MKLARYHLSSSDRVSAKEGIGVPLMPVENRMNMSSTSVPDLIFHGRVTFLIRIGNPQSSFLSNDFRSSPVRPLLINSLSKACMPVPESPLLTTLKRSSFVGSSPLCVVLNLKVPSVKSLGLGSMKSAAGPFPSPRRP